MIIDPDFLHHWKVKALSATIGTAEALTAVISLWAHCQNRKEWRFPLTSRMLAGICQYTGDHTSLMQEMLACGFLDDVGEGVFEVHGWAEKNAKIIQCWNAGNMGGRPQNNRTVNPTVNPTTNRTVNPTKTPRETDKIRVEEIREEKKAYTEENAPAGDALILDSSPPEKKRQGKASSVEEVIFFAESVNAMESEARDFWDRMEAGGWTRDGKKLSDWKAHFRVYHRKGWLHKEETAEEATNNYVRQEVRQFTAEDTIIAMGGGQEAIERRRRLLAKFDILA